MKIYKISLNNLNNLKKKELIKILGKEKVLILRGLISKKEVKKAKEKIEKIFSVKNDKIRPKNSYHLIKKNYQRLIVGMGGGLVQSRTNSRVMRTLYNPLYCKDIYGMHKIFIKMLKFQNFLYGLNSEYGINKKKTEHNLFVASRINQYLSGGGFLSPHKDSSAALASKSLFKNKYFQLLLTMSKKGKDYKLGGGIIEKKGKLVEFDDYTDLGDIILYNSQTNHGVMDIDGNKKLDLKKLGGRLTAAVTFFKY